MSVKSIALIASVLLAPLTASAVTATFDFSGQITNILYPATGLTLGEAVHGSFTFNYNSGDVITGKVGSRSSPWSITSRGVPYDPVLSTVLYLGSLNEPVYTSSLFAPASDPDDSSGAKGSVNQFFAYESTPAYELSSFLTISGYSPYRRNGLPALHPGDTASGGFILGQVGADFSVTHLKFVQAPEIDPSSFATSATLLFGTLAVLRGRRREP